MSHEPLILIVEDEREMRKFLRTALTSRGHRVLEAERCREVVMLVTSHNVDAMLLDLGLPDGDGLDVIRELREWSKVPIIVISARGQEDDKVTALDAGADDYLTKPFGTQELMARVRVALRHAAKGSAPEPIYELGELRVDLGRREVTRAGAEVHLTPIEYKLLSLFVRNAGRVLTHRQILKEVWGPTHAAQSHYVRVHMAELRKKIEPEPARPRILITELGVGYRLRDK